MIAGSLAEEIKTKAVPLEYQLAILLVGTNQESSEIVNFIFKPGPHKEQVRTVADHRPGH